MRFFTKEVKIALVTIIGIVILFFGLNFLKGVSLFSDNQTYYIRFDNVTGLSASNPIFADGYQVGSVKEIQYDYGNHSGVVVTCNINKAMRIPLGSTAEISSDMMGNVKMNLLLANNPREAVQPGDTIEGNMNIGMLGVVQEMVPALKSTLAKVDTLLNNVNALLSDRHLAGTLQNVDVLTGNLATSTVELNRLLAQTNKTLPILMAKTNATLDNTTKLTGNLAAVDVQSTMQKVNATLENVQQFSQKLNSNQGTLGLMLNDNSLYYNLNATAKHADSLVIDLKTNPKRYVHFSIFGRKN